MQITTFNTLFPSVTVNKPAQPVNWQPGQTLRGEVLSSVQQGLVQLRIGSTVLMAKISAEVEIGQKLALEVITAGDRPVLRAVNQDAVARLIESTIRSVLPRQQDHAILLSDIKQLIQQNLTPRLPPAVQQAFNRLYQSFADKAVVTTPEGLRDAVRNSGIFMESRLASGQRANQLSLTSDFKANLLRLREALQTAAGPASNTAAQQTTAPGRQQTPIQPQGLTYQLNAASRPGTSVPVTPSVTTGQQTAAASTTTASLSARTQTTGANPLNFTSPAGTNGAQRAAPQTLTPRQPVIQTTTNTPAQQPATSNQTTNASAPVTTTREGAVTPPPAASSPTAQPTAANNPGQNRAVHVTTPGSPLLSTPTSGPTAASLIGTTHTQGVPAAEASIAAAANNPFRMQSSSDVVRAAERFAQLDSLTKILAQFLKDADSSLARLQLNQLSHQPAEVEQKPAWLFDIPVKYGERIDLFRFRIQQDAHTNPDDPEANGWTIQVSFDIDTLGPVFARITLYQQQAAITFWTENKQTQDGFQQYFQTLQDDLEDSGIEVGKLSCILGCPPESFARTMDSGILDEQA